MAAGTLVSSGSSGNMPTGSGSERLCRASIKTLNNQWQNILSGTAGHIYTILSLIFCEQQSVSGTLAIQVNTGGYDIRIITSTHLANETFVWNDKFVIEEDDDLEVYNTVTHGDWYVTYIDQDWT